MKSTPQHPAVLRRLSISSLGLLLSLVLLITLILPLHPDSSRNIPQPPLPPGPPAPWSRQQPSTSQPSTSQPSTSQPSTSQPSTSRPSLPRSIRQLHQEIYHQNPYTPAQILRSIQAAYPNQVETVRRTGGEWEITVNGQTFRWARSRLLPAGIQAQWKRYEPYLFFDYWEPVFLNLTPEQEARLLSYTAERMQNPPTRHPGFFNALFSVPTRADSYREIKPVTFLGRTVHIHRDIRDNLQRVDQSLQKSRKDSRRLDQYLREIQQIGGFHWRTIRSSNSRSMHSYGMALDILPRSYGDKHVYWEWTREIRAEKWYRIPVKDRYAPPEEFTAAMEEEGFIWGGNWVFFDTIHYEYRPDILHLAAPGTLSSQADM